MAITRRSVLTGAAAPWILKGARPGIARIEPGGVLIREPAVDGERRRDDCVPAHPNGIPLSRTRWLLVFATRKFRGTDDDTSVLWQLRENTPDGRVLREGIFAKSVDNWDPFGDGKHFYVRQQGSPVAFGVPKGAKIKGRPAVNANVFVCKFRRVAREIDPKTNVVKGTDPDPRMVAQTGIVEWVQFRLNDKEDDLVILQPTRQMRQKGYESGRAYCRHEQATNYAQEKVNPLPYSEDRTEWVDLMSSNLGYAAVRSVFNPKTRLYEWVETGPLLHDKDRPRNDMALARYRDSWVIGARTDYVEDHQKRGLRGIDWLRTDDPVKRTAPVAHSFEPPCACPVTFYTCADGVLRLFAGCGPRSPHKNERDPLYFWEIDPDRGFRGSNPLTVFDTVAAKLPIRPEAMPKVDMGKLLAHGGGAVQYAVHRVSLQSLNYDHFHPKEGFWNENPQPWTFPALNEREKGACAIYYAKVHYTEPQPPAWDFK